MSRLFRPLWVLVIAVVGFGMAGFTYRPASAAGDCYRLQAMTDDSGLYIYAIFNYFSADLIYFDFNAVAGNTQVTVFVLTEDDRVNLLQTVVAGAVVVVPEGYTDTFGDASVTNVDLEGACTKVLGIMDGRLNRRDLGATSFVFPTKDGFNVVEFDRTSQRGLIEFSVTKAEIAAALETAKQTGQNQKIGSKSGALYGSTLYALTSGECQLNANQPDGKPYTFIFDCQ